MMMTETEVRELLLEHESNLVGWREPDASGVGGGYLVPTEPDVAERARVRISLRAVILTLRVVLREVDPEQVREFEAADHRDLQRIRDAAVADERSSK